MKHESDTIDPIDLTPTFYNNNIPLQKRYDCVTYIIESQHTRYLRSVYIPGIKRQQCTHI